MEIRSRIQQLLGILAEGLYEKDDELAMALLAAVSGQSLFLLGPPGVAKSMIARRTSLAFSHGGRAFEYLMNRFSTPDEIFGPVSISDLRNDRYHRLVEGYLPDAEVVFLDEIWKASPSIQNTLLTVLNEKIYRNGSETLRLPLQLLIAASNELPAQGEGLEALWDRFLLRRMVSGISRQDLFDRMLLDAGEHHPQVPAELALSMHELALWRDSILRITLGTDVLSIIHQLRQQLPQPDLYVSDRRWRHAAHVLRASAFLNGSERVRITDVLLLAHMLWNEPSQQPEVNRILTRSISAALLEDMGVQLAQERLDALRDELRSTRQYGVGPSAAAACTPRRVHSFYYQLQHPGSTPIYIYISEFEKLPADGSQVPFILINDRKKTGAQILKQYERSRHPGIFPKDILQVSLQPGHVVVNGNVYPLVTDDTRSGFTMDGVADSAARRQQQAAHTQAEREMMEAVTRVAAQAEELRQRFVTLREREEQYLRGHLFIDQGTQVILQNALREIQYAINRLATDAGELTHLQQ